MRDNDIRLQSAIFRSSLMILCTFVRPRYVLFNVNIIKMNGDVHFDSFYCGIHKEITSNVFPLFMTFFSVLNKGTVCHSKVILSIFSNFCTFK